MGCDIHSFAEVRKSGRWEMAGDVFPLDRFERNRPDKERKERGESPFYYRNYSLFGFLANVRNYSHVPPISEPRGLPNDISKEIKERADRWGAGGHSHSWLLLSEMLEIDYEEVFWDRRVTKRISSNIISGAEIAQEGEGRHVTLREHLKGSNYFSVIETLKELGEPENVRVVFWFDN